MLSAKHNNDIFQDSMSLGFGNLFLPANIILVGVVSSLVCLGGERWRIKGKSGRGPVDGKNGDASDPDPWSTRAAVAGFKAKTAGLY